MSGLAVTNLDAGYGKKQVLFDVAVQVEASQIALVVGPNGSGKSTLLKALFGLCQIYRAKELSFLGRELRKLGGRELLAAGLSYVPQHRNVFDRLTVRENLTLSADTRADDAGKAREAFHKILDIVPELTPLLARRAGQLSGGERHLLAIALALIVGPKLALLDEPLAGLDERSVRRVSEVIAYYRATHGVAFLIVEHRFTKLTSLADRCYGLRLGRSVVSLNAAQISDPTTFESAMRQVFFE
jgi:ABC-type branched-subunit amino acid transport system ATPase component